MNHDTAMQILRLSRLETKAREYRERAAQCGNVPRMLRAARLEEAANAKVMSFGEVTSYSDRD
jgi:hypothetical protein